MTVKYISYILIKITNSLPSRQTTQVKRKTRREGEPSERKNHDILWLRRRADVVLFKLKHIFPPQIQPEFSFNIVAILSLVSWNKKRMVNKKKIAQTRPSAIQKTQFHTQSKKSWCQKVGLQSWETRWCLNASKTRENWMPLPWQPDPNQGGEDEWMDDSQHLATAAPNLTPTVPEVIELVKQVKMEIWVQTLIPRFLFFIAFNFLVTFLLL